MRPDWKDAPDWAQWLAQDADGQWCWYDSIPEPNMLKEVSGVDGWGSEFHNQESGYKPRYEKALKAEPTEDWRETLEARSHTSEPWREGKGNTGAVVADAPAPGIKGSDAVEHYGGHLICESTNRVNRRRIIACVNACKGLKTDWLEKIVAEGSSLDAEMQKVREARPKWARVDGRDVPVHELIEAYCRYHETTRCHRGHETLPLKLWDCPECHEITRQKCSTLIETLYRFTAYHPDLLRKNGLEMLAEQVEAAKKLLDEMKPYRVFHFGIDLAADVSEEAKGKPFHGPSLMNEAQIDAPAHEPTSDELNDMHEPEGEPWIHAVFDSSKAFRVSVTDPGYIRCEVVDLYSATRDLSDELEMVEEHYSDEVERKLQDSAHLTSKPGGFSSPEAIKERRSYYRLWRERDQALDELRAIREVVDANPEESTLDEVRRVAVQRGNLLDANQVIANLLFGDGDYRLPCDVMLPPGTTFRKGVSIKVLLTGLKQREGRDCEFIKYSEDEKARQERLSRFLRTFRLQPHWSCCCSMCNGDGCIHCEHTGRRHKNGKPVYHLSEVQEFIKTECDDFSRHCGFPGGMNQP